MEIKKRIKTTKELFATHKGTKVKHDFEGTYLTGIVVGYTDTSLIVTVPPNCTDALPSWCEPTNRSARIDYGLTPDRADQEFLYIEAYNIK